MTPCEVCKNDIPVVTVRVVAVSVRVLETELLNAYGGIVGRAVQIDSTNYVWCVACPKPDTSGHPRPLK